ETRTGAVPVRETRTGAVFRFVRHGVLSRPLWAPSPAPIRLRFAVAEGRGFGMTASGWVDNPIVRNQCGQASFKRKRTLLRGCHPALPAAAGRRRDPTC